MPYKNNTELPDTIRKNLSEPAQDVYREAFNNAWDQYQSPRGQEITHNLDESAHSVAWAAVQNFREKNEKTTNP
ncbi:ChaB family protein [Flavilitoribacter nigricans]|uniref:Cation transport regulator ChaB n=1 Tax=Flavilitoribacter nigricans (strain ATCC 23147 / DSM 23189 / NBRC 102662 / NCIMB 1420 / SS-2) TaxID=1122177 RepID=A0A2D0NGH7_FLAN2|nr:ChaB family protein [Flavilitoribacter nigricans]PHN07577.1 cation transport regulator ChaB [Flavilitoribacter nigricans DSM 23189 = NBRC 102662]